MEEGDKYINCAKCEHKNEFQNCEVCNPPEKKDVWQLFDKEFGVIPDPLEDEPDRGWTSGGELSKPLKDFIKTHFIPREELAKKILAVQEKIHQRIMKTENIDELDKYINCAKCHIPLDWNGADMGKITRVRGIGVLCSECLESLREVK